MEKAAVHHNLFCSDTVGWILAHGLGGTLMIAAGLWWTGNVLSNFLADSGSRPFKSRMTYPGPIRQVLVDSWFFVVIAGSIAIFLAIGGVLTSKIFGILHVVMLLSFTGFGVVSLMIHHKALQMEGLDVAAFILAFYIKLFVTYTHLNGKSSSVAQAHSYLLITDVLVIFATLLERFRRDSAVCALARPYFVMIEGFYLIYIAFRFTGCTIDLHNAKDVHPSLEVVVIFTSLHLVITAIVLLIGWLIRLSKCDHHVCAYKQLGSEVA